MALDEAIELAGAIVDPDLLRSLNTAQTVTRELHALLNASRELARTGVRTTTTLRELVARAGERVGVSVRGPIPDVALEVAAPAMIQALALVIDVAAGAGRGRSVDGSATVVGGTCTLVLPTAATAPPNASELLAIAAFVIVRERGELRCGENRLTLTIPAAAPP